MTTSKGVIELSEKQLIEQAQNGDKDAFCTLYEIYKDKLYKYAFYRLGNEEDAKDAVSDCVVSAYKQVSSLRKPDAFQKWIFRILYFSCNKYIDEQVKRRESMNFDDISNTYTESGDKAENKTEVMQALEILNDEEKNIVILSVISGLKSREIAQTMELTAGSVRSKLSRSLSKMRSFLEQS